MLPGLLRYGLLLFLCLQNFLLVRRELRKFQKLCFDILLVSPAKSNVFFAKQGKDLFYNLELERFGLFYLMLKNLEVGVLRRVVLCILYIYLCLVLLALHREWICNCRIIFHLCLSIRGFQGLFLS